MDSHPMDDRDVEDAELAERLDAYAEARLSPSLSASSRMRASVMAAAQRQAALARADVERAALAAAEVASQPRVVPMPRWRRPVAALLAASLTLALAVGSVAAAQPGGPLYGDPDLGRDADPALIRRRARRRRGSPAQRSSRRSRQCRGCRQRPGVCRCLGRLQLDPRRGDGRDEREIPSRMRRWTSRSVGTSRS